MKVLILLLFLLIPIRSFAPNESEKVEKEQYVSQFEIDEKTLDFALVTLKDGTRKTRKEVYHLSQSVIDVYLRRKNYQKMFPNMEDSVSHALACIFVSESSNAKGHSGRSSLWIYHTNPFGLTSSQGVTKKSWEMIKGKRVVMNVTFRHFNNFEETIDALMWDYLYKERYTRVQSSSSVKEFLYNLYKCGYMTNHNWPYFAYNEIYLKSIKDVQ